MHYTAVRGVAFALPHPEERMDLQRALLIDDDRLVRTVLGEIVTSFGYRTDVAAGGADGLTLLEQNDYDVVLTDLLMPQMSGWQVLAAVRARDAHTPVIIITGSAVHPDDDRIAQPGVLLVRKPVEPGLLREALSRALRAGVPPACPG